MEAENEIILYQPDSTVKLEVRLGEDTVWLTQRQIADLFGTKVPAISKHLKNIFDSGELDRDATISKMETVVNRGFRGTSVELVDHYNLDAILSVGYRVNSKNATLFRQWANKILKEYLLRGYNINQRLMQMESRIDQRFLEHDKRLDELSDKVDFFVRSSLPPVEGIIYDGRIFDAYVFVCDLIQSAKKRVVVIDNYADHSVLSQLDKRSPGVSAMVYTSEKNERITSDLKRHDAQYPPIDLKIYSNVHDRFLIIDDTVYLIGASLKDLGKKLCGFTKLESISGNELLSSIKTKKEKKKK